MDITKIAEEVARDEEGVTFTVLQKNGDPYLAADGSEATLTVVGSDSKRVRHAKDAQTRRMLRRGRTKLEPQDLRNNRIEVAAAAVIGWHGWEKDGEPWPLAAENVSTLLSVDHILLQAEEKIDEPRAFFENSLAPSSNGSGTTPSSKNGSKTARQSATISHA